jgi:hypothetical protein
MQATGPLLPPFPPFPPFPPVAFPPLPAFWLIVWPLESCFFFFALCLVAAIADGAASPATSMTPVTQTNALRTRICLPLLYFNGRHRHMPRAAVPSAGISPDDFPAAFRPSPAWPTRPDITPGWVLQVYMSYPLKSRIEVPRLKVHKRETKEVGVSAEDAHPDWNYWVTF